MTRYVAPCCNCRARPCTHVLGVPSQERQVRFAKFLRGRPRFIIKGEMYFRLKPSLHFVPSPLLKVDSPAQWGVVSRCALAWPWLHSVPML